MAYPMQHSMAYEVVMMKLKLMILFGFHGKRHVAREKRVLEILKMIGE